MTERSCMTWSISADSRPATPPSPRDPSYGHPVVIESTTGTVACGYSWCTGACGFPALVLTTSNGHELKAHGIMVACGPVFQEFRVAWTGEKVPVTPGDATEEQLLRMYWR